MTLGTCVHGGVATNAERRDVGRQEDTIAPLFEPRSVVYDVDGALPVIGAVRNAWQESVVAVDRNTASTAADAVDDPRRVLEGAICRDSEGGVGVALPVCLNARVVASCLFFFLMR